MISTPGSELPMESKKSEAIKPESVIVPEMKKDESVKPEADAAKSSEKEII